MMSTKCPDPDRIRDYLLGVLNQADGDDVERHLAECDSCREVADACEAAEDSLVQLVRGAWRGDSVPAEAESEFRQCRALAWAKSLPEAFPSSSAAGPSGTVGPSGDTIVQGEGFPRRFGPFELVAVLGHGSYGRVYRAWDRRLDREVAIKIPRAGVLGDAHQVARFLREGRSAAQLRHQYIVPVHEAGQIEGVYYIASDFIEGTSLAARMQQDERLTHREAAVLVARLAEALDYAHSRGIVHRDVKPANILLDGAGEPHLVDFGLARRDEPDSLQTEEGVLLGTPAYMSPEQVRGDSHRADARSDLWALGVILYELLTGQRPFQGSRLELFAAIRDHEPETPRRVVATVPRDLETICLKCLAKSPERRYASCRKLAEELGRWLRGEPIEARPVSPLERSARWCRRNPVLALLLAVVAASLVGGTVVSSYFAVRARQQAVAASASAAEAEESARVARREEGRANDKAREAAAALDDVRKAHATTRRFLYAAQMSLVLEHWRQQDFAGMATLLETLKPGPGEEDLRGFEWHYFWRLIHGYRHLLGSDSEPCFDGLLTDEGRTVITSGHGVAFWDATSGRKIKAIPGDQTRICYLADTRPSLLVYATAPTLTVWRLQEDRLEPLYEDPEAADRLAVCFSPDGKLAAIAAVTIETTEWLKVVELERGEALYRIERPEVRTCPLAFSPDGSLLALGTAWRALAGDVLLYDARTGEEKQRLEGHIGAPSCAAFSPDGRTLASVDGAHVRLWNVADGKQLKRYATPIPSYPDTLAFSPSGIHLAGAGASSPSVVVWAADDPGPVRRLYGHVVTRACFSSDGRTLLTAGTDGTCRLWDTAETGSDEVRTSAHGRSGEVRDLTVAPDGTCVATAATDGTVRLWSLPDGRLLHVLEGHLGTVHTVRFSPDGDTLYSGSEDKSIRLWDTKSGTQRQIYWERAPVHSLAVSRNGDILVTGTSGEGVTLWDLASGRWHPLKHSGPSWLAVGSIAIAPDGRTVAAGCSDATIRFWDTASSQQVGVLRGHEVRGVASEGQVESVAFSPDGKLLASIGRDATVRLWDVERRQAAATLREPAVRLYSVEFSPDGRWLVAAGGDREMRGEIHQWDLSAGPAAARCLGGARAWCQRSAIRTAFTPDGSRLISGADDGSIGVWEPDARGAFQYQRKWPGHEAAVQCLAFSPDGSVLAVGKRDSTVELLDAVTGRMLHRLSGPADVISCLAFSPDGRVLAGGSWDATTTLWDADAGRVLGIIPRYVIGISHGVDAVAFSHDGTLLAVAAAREVRLFDPATLNVRRQLDYPREVLRTLAFSSDDRLLACGGGGWWDNSRGDLLLWNIQTGELVHQVPFETNPVLFARFLEQDQTLILWRDGPIEFWDVASGTRRNVLPVRGRVAMSSDGRSMAIMQPRGELSLWDPHTAKQRSMLPPAPRPLTVLALSPDAQMMALGDDTGMVSVRRAEPLPLREVAGGGPVRNGRPIDHRAAALHQLARFRWKLTRWLPDDDTRRQARRETVALYEQLVAQYPQNAEYRFELAETHRLHALRSHISGSELKGPSARQAVELFEDLARQQPSSVVFLRSLRDSYAGLAIDLFQGERKNPEEAATAIRRAIEASEQVLRQNENLSDRQNHAHLLHRLGAQMRLLERWEEAAASFQRSLAGYAELQRRPDFAELTSSSVMWRDRSLALLAATVAGDGSDRDSRAYPHVVEAWTTLAASFPGVARFRYELARCHLRRGIGLTNQRQPDQAVACFDRSISVLRALHADYARVAQYRNDLANVLRWRARSLEDQALFAESLSDLDEAVALDPESAAGLRQLAVFLATLPDADASKHSRAAALANKAAQLEPAKASTWLALGIAAYRERRWIDAATCLGSSPGSSEPLGLLFLAMTYWQLGDPDRAKDCFHQAAGHRTGPANPREARIRDEARRLLDLPSS